MSWSDIFIPAGSQTSDEQQANYERQQRLLAERMAQRQAEGAMTADQAQLYNTLQTLDNQDAAAAQGFQEGLKEGLNNVTGTISGTLAGAIKAIWASIPWQLLVLGAIALFVYLGGLNFLRIKLAKSA